MKKSFLLIAIIPILFFIGLRSSLISFFSTQQLYGEYDAFLSDETVYSINSTLTELFHHHTSAQEIINQLQQKFSFLKKITIAYQPLAIRVKISAHKPLCLVNNVSVLTAQTNLFPKNIFSHKVIETIPDITVKEEHSQMAYTVSHVLEKLPSDIYHTHIVEFLHEHTIRLMDKKQPNFTIVSSLKEPIVSTALNYCNMIKCNLETRGEFNKEGKWIADTRFAHYIVAYKA